MYGIDDESSAYFTQGTLTANDIRQKLRLTDYLAGWVIDDFVFKPCGYSMNAIKGHQYCTIHLTPQQEYSYVSFETNVGLDEIIAIPLAVFNPESFDVVLYQHHQSFDGVFAHVGSEFTMQQEQQKSLDCGYEMMFTHWKRTVGVL
jgi:S-adenosylmethionine decarboxylase